MNLTNEEHLDNYFKRGSVEFKKMTENIKRVIDAEDKISILFFLFISKDFFEKSYERALKLVNENKKIIKREEIEKRVTTISEKAFKQAIKEIEERGRTIEKEEETKKGVH